MNRAKNCEIMLTRVKMPLPELVVSWGGLRCSWEY